MAPARHETRLEANSNYTAPCAPGTSFGTIKTCHGHQQERDVGWVCVNGCCYVSAVHIKTLDFFPFEIPGNDAKVILAFFLSLFAAKGYNNTTAWSSSKIWSLRGKQNLFQVKMCQNACSGLRPELGNSVKQPNWELTLHPGVWIVSLMGVPGSAPASWTSGSSLVAGKWPGRPCPYPQRLRCWAFEEGRRDVDDPGGTGGRKVDVSAWLPACCLNTQGDIW